MNNSFLSQINTSWSLFLDRDGVINKRIIDGYVRKVEEMILLPQVQEAFHIFKAKFKHIFIVTNQQGIGKGLMTEQDLQQVHNSMLQQIGVPITRIYYSPFLAKENNIMRKPQIGMALQAKRDYPDVDFNHAVMVGDSESDMQFGINSGMHTVFICSDIAADLGEMQCESLYHFASMLP